MENNEGGAVATDGQVGLGVDIVEIDRIRRILQRTPSFARRVYSEAERAYCDATATPEMHYATRFAAKEAVVKALGTGFTDGIGVRDIEVRRTAKGRPYVVLSGRAREVARERGVRELPVSLSYTHTDAVACAMAITESSMRVAQERVDPMEELARQFKEARALLDEAPSTPTPEPAQMPAAASTSAQIPAPAAVSTPVPAAASTAMSTSENDASQADTPRMFDECRIAQEQAPFQSEL